MPRFFVNEEQIDEDRITVYGNDAHHISDVLRMKPGEKLTVCDFFNREYFCEILSCDGGKVELSVLEKRLCRSELPFDVTLCMALPKSDKMEWIIQKAVELGVNSILPFSSAHTVMKLDAKAAEKKVERWQKIAKAAAEQCGRGKIPEIRLPVTFKEALRQTSGKGEVFLCYEAEDGTTLKTYFSENPSPKSLTFFVGAEGGFDKKEVEEAKAAGVHSVSLGNRILRCETAPLFVLSAIGYVYEL